MKWIKLKDKKPDHGQRILIWNYNTEEIDCVSFIHFTGTIKANEETNKYIAYYFLYEHIDHNLYHDRYRAYEEEVWMELPEGPYEMD